MPGTTTHCPLCGRAIEWRGTEPNEFWWCSCCSLGPWGGTTGDCEHVRASERSEATP